MLSLLHSAINCSLFPLLLEGHLFGHFMCVCAFSQSTFPGGSKNEVFHLFSLIFIEIILRFFTLYFFGRFFDRVFCPCRLAFRFFFGQAVYLYILNSVMFSSGHFGSAWFSLFFFCFVFRLSLEISFLAARACSYGLANQ